MRCYCSSMPQARGIPRVVSDGQHAASCMEVRRKRAIKSRQGCRAGNLEMGSRKQESRRALGQGVGEPGRVVMTMDRDGNNIN